jgi:predicted XRE-type DNA-binding protein
MYRPDPVPALKERLAREILMLLDGWSQINAGELIRADQARISELRAGHLERFSIERLIRFLVQLGRDVAIVTSRSPRPSVLRHERVDGRRNGP